MLTNEFLEEDIEEVLSPLTCYPLKAPSDNSVIYPNVVYTNITGLPIRTHSGNATNRYRYRFSCWGKSYRESLTTAKIVKEKLDLNKTDFELATKENELKTIEIEPNLYSTVLEFFIWSTK